MGRSGIVVRMSEAHRFRESVAGNPNVGSKELQEILAQRKNRGLPEIKTLDETVGLAVSGGGIRSATFGLGVMQELREQRLLDRVDYLSTVSGGGYIGGWFMGNRLRREAEGGKDEFLKDEHESVRHLRRFGRYLTPRSGFLSADTWTALAIWLRNTVALQVLLLLFLMLVMLIPYAGLPLFDLISGASLPMMEEGDIQTRRENLEVWNLTQGGMIGLAGLLACFCLLRVSRGGRADVGVAEPTARTRKMRDGFHQVVAGLEKHSWGRLLTRCLNGCVLWMRERTKWIDACVILLLMHVGFMTPALLWGLMEVNELHIHAWEHERIRQLCLMVSGLMVVTRVVCRSAPRCRGLVKFALSLVAQFAVVYLLTLVLAHAAISLLLDILSLELPQKLGLTNLHVRHAGFLMTLEWRLILGAPMCIFFYSLLIGAGISMGGKDLDDRFREWWARIGAWLFIVSLASLLLCAVALKGPELVAWVLPRLELRLPALLGWIVTSGIGLQLAGGAGTNGVRHSGVKEKLVLLAPLFFFSGLLLAVACLVDGLMRFSTEHWGELNTWLSGVLPSGWSEWLHSPLIRGDGPLLVVIACLCVVLAVALTHLDINELSMNLFYRNRLMRCYLGAARPGRDRRTELFTGFDFGDDLPLHQMQHAVKPGFRGPFWIVNTAVNTAKNPDLDVAERLAESFAMTPLFCGYERAGMGVGSGFLEKVRQGYRPTGKYMNGQMTAGAAISISGAAASPNSGYHTSPLIAFMLTVFNARLGWWAANPAQAKGWDLASPPVYRPMGWYVMKELFGSASIKDPFIYLSDGGHFENLGLYELVRRRCKVIIVSDAEEDGGYTFHGLGTAIRRCWVDFGVRLEIDTHSISPETEGGPCRGHCAIGRIIYDSDDSSKDGTLVYLKSSWTGDEPTDLLQYRAANPGFPHESTGDQFFSESQFESYRKLGRHVAKTCFDASMNYLKQTDPGLLDASERHEGADAPTQAKFLERFSETLRHYWAPLTEGSDSEFIRNTEMLVGIWRDVQTQADLQWMERVILPAPGCNFKVRLEKEVWPVDELSKGQRLAGRLLCQRLFQLMENVYLDLDLARTTSAEDNSGWMNLFRHWARFSFVEAEWETAKPTYGERFAAFWDQQLAPVNQRPPVHSQADPKIQMEYHLNREQKARSRLQTRLDHLIRKMRSGR